MDQKALRGIGNSYADEILYYAGVSPFSIAKAIPEKQIPKLFNRIKTVLEKAINEMEKANGDGLKGELRDFMTIHDPKLNQTAKGETIKIRKIGGGTPYYTDGEN